MIAILHPGYLILASITGIKDTFDPEGAHTCELVDGVGTLHRHTEVKLGYKSYNLTYGPFGRTKSKIYLLLFTRLKTQMISSAFNPWTEFGL